jgi:hypothetical protein
MAISAIPYSPASFGSSSDQKPIMVVNSTFDTLGVWNITNLRNCAFRINYDQDAGDRTNDPRAGRKAAQLTLPADVRRALDVQEGDFLEA